MKKGILLCIVIVLLVIAFYTIFVYAPNQERKNYEEHKAQMREFYSCLDERVGYYWDNEKGECLPFPKIEGCEDYEEFEIIMTSELPIGYNITNNYHDDFLSIRITCLGGFIKEDNKTCHETGLQEDGYENLPKSKIDYYRISTRKPIELCWEEFA